VGNLKLNKETVKNLAGSEKRQVKGGALGRIEVRYPPVGTGTC